MIIFHFCVICPSAGRSKHLTDSKHTAHKTQCLLTPEKENALKNTDTDRRERLHSALAFTAVPFGSRVKYSAAKFSTKTLFEKDAWHEHKITADLSKPRDGSTAPAGSPHLQITRPESEGHLIES